MIGETASLPYRHNVGAVLFNGKGKVFVGHRAIFEAIDRISGGWQLPQGGIDADENPRAAVLRELGEEIGTKAAEIIAEVPEWLNYDFPPDIAERLGNRYRGQTQRWFALRFLGTDGMIRLDADPHPEFNAWRWADLAELPTLAVAFKRPIYERLVHEFSYLEQEMT